MTVLQDVIECELKRSGGQTYGDEVWGGGDGGAKAPRVT